MTTKAREPGDVGRVAKGVPIEWSLLTEWSQMKRDGIIALSWPDFVNEAISHELARYKAKRRRKE